MTVRLNLACGKKPKGDGWINVDLVRPENLNGHIFMPHDLRDRFPLDDGTVDEIYAKHIIEHFNRDEWDNVLADWARLLKSGGVLVIECPDIIKCTEAFVHDLMGFRWSWWHHTIYGHPVHGGHHKQGFDMPRLRHELTGAGFKVTRLRNWGDDSNMDYKYNIRCEAVKV